MDRQSKRFKPSRLVELLVPVVLAVLALALLAALVLVALSLIGATPNRLLGG
jgi:hypothetical protein